MAIHLPAVSAEAREFERIRRARNSVKYPDDPLDYEETTLTDAWRWFATASSIFGAVRDEPLRRYRLRHPPRA